ncbi:carbohydrate-binding family 9-like protein [Devosia sp.]|jgi:hypothetical protein|uniref:carbohydrate-binding family 9-like protein n=1 Tax=Devosia sp. TaxID=1871048 RepID=UPI0037BE5D7F
MTAAKTNPNGYGLVPGTYQAHRAKNPVRPDGRAASPAWATAPRTPRFVDMLGGAPAPLDTTAAILWDDEALHIAFWAAEPNLSATMTTRDDLLFFENDLEIFIDGGDSYYELEFNPLGTIYEVFYLWRDAYTRGSKWDTPRFDVHNPRVQSFGGDYPRDRRNFWTGNHPRGTRWAFLDYDLPGLAVRTHYDGTLNDPSTLDRGWTAEITIPWAGLVDLANGRSLPPRPGDTWGIFMGRFQQLQTRGPAETATAGWAAHRFGVADTHVPECFTQVTFVD